MDPSGWRSWRLIVTFCFALLCTSSSQRRIQAKTLKALVFFHGRRLKPKHIPCFLGIGDSQAQAQTQGATEMHRALG